MKLATDHSLDWVRRRGFRRRPIAVGEKIRIGTTLKQRCAVLAFNTDQRGVGA